MRIKRWLVVIGICLGLLLVLGFTKFMQIKAAIEFGNSFPESSETVETVVTQINLWQPTIDVVGEVRAKQQVEIRTESAGIITEVGFNSGGRVEKGDRLLRLDTSEEQARLAMIKPEIDLAKLEVERLSPLVKKQAVSQQVFDRAQVALAVAQAQEAEVNEEIANKTVLAPFTGTAGIHQFEKGQVISDNTLVTQLVGDLSSLWVDFYLPQKYANLEIGTQVTIRNQDDLRSSAIAKVIAVEPTISNSSRTIKARAEFQNSVALKPGAIVKVTTPVATARNVVTVPGTAIRRDGFGAFVFVLQENQDGKVRAHRRPVSIAEQNIARVSVLEGLEPGERVATMGSFKLREGIWVKDAADQEGHQAASVLPDSTDNATSTPTANKSTASSNEASDEVETQTNH